MRRLLMLSLVAVLAAGTIGCAGVAIDRSPSAIGLYAKQGGTHKATEIHPGEAQKVTGYAKKGEAKSRSILGIINLGDASMTEAARNGRIENVHHVTVDKKGILGLYATKTVTVFGE